VSKRDATLLDQIEDDAVNGRPIADTLRKTVILGGKAGSTALRDWATRELKGYGPDDDLPEYRIVGAPICVDAFVGNGWIKGQRMSIHELPKFAQESIKEQVALAFPVGEIEAIIRNVEKGEDSTAHLSLPGAADLVLLWNHESTVPYHHIQSAYWSVSVTSLHGVVDQVRTTLAELAAEMRAGTPQGHDLPSADVTNQAVSVAVHGKNARVVVTSQAAGGDAIVTTGEPGPKDPGWWTVGRVMWTAVVGVATIAAAVFGYLALRH
jgi:hypothetical protein